MTGTELKKLFESVNIQPSIGCRCKELMLQMDVWGPEGCRQHYFEIVNQLEEDARKYKWKDRIGAAGRSILTGLAFKVNLLNPIASLLDEAIRRSEDCRPA